MSQKVRIHKLSFKLSRESGRRLALSLAFALLSVAGIRESRANANSQPASAQVQGRSNRAAMEKFQEGEALLARGTAESIRLAVKKYEEALSILRAINEREGEAVVLSRSGYAYNLLGEKQKALDLYNQALPLYQSRARILHS